MYTGTPSLIIGSNIPSCIYGFDDIYSEVDMIGIAISSLKNRLLQVSDPSCLGYDIEIKLFPFFSNNCIM